MDPQLGTSLLTDGVFESPMCFGLDLVYIVSRPLYPQHVRLFLDAFLFSEVVFESGQETGEFENFRVVFFRVVCFRPPLGISILPFGYGFW